MWLELVKFGATVSAGFLNASPLQGALWIWRSRTVGAKSPVPMAMVALNGAVWSTYGVVLRNWVPLVAANMIGVVSGMVGLVVYTMYEPIWNLIFGLVVGIFGLLGCLQSVMIAPSEYPKTQSIYGSFCVCVTIAMYSSPLVTLKDVIRSRSTTSLSFATTLAALACSSLWFVYGVSLPDVNVWLPNVAGIILSLVQVALFWRFRKKTNGSHLSIT